RLKDRRRPTYRIANPDFPMEMSLDRQIHPPYTPNHQKQCLINTQFSGSCKDYLSLLGGNFSLYCQENLGM
ncbi:MAG: hypothetical protein KBA52_08435, partial [Candidatus Kapabacteria bacterium]|nr:hypothetical protein [Candidatus Kapabacteria bacterium]